MSGSAGFTHEQNISSIATHNLLYLFFKTLFWLYSKPLHWTIKRCRKHKGKFEQGNIGLYLQTCGVLFGLLLPMFFICNAPESLAAKAHHPHNIIADLLGILTEKPQLNLFGFGYVTVFTRILKEGQAQVFTTARKTTTRWKANTSSAKMLLLLLLLSGNGHLNPGPLCHSDVNPTVQNIIPLQSEPSAVISPIKSVLIGQPTTSTELTLTLVPDGVCHGEDGASAALGSRLAGEDICRRGSLVEPWMGEQESPAATVGNSETGDHRPTGALGEAIGFLQRPQSYPSASEGNTEP